MPLQLLQRFAEISSKVSMLFWLNICSGNHFLEIHFSQTLTFINRMLLSESIICAIASLIL